MDRREFLRRLAQLTTAAAGSTLVGCRRGERPDPDEPETPDEPAEPDIEPTTVAVVATDDRAEGTHRAVELLEDELPGGDVLIKPNLNSADPPPASTHNSVLEALVRHVQSERADSITVGDRSGMAETRDVMTAKQLFSMGDELGFEPIAFDELEDQDWEIIDRDHHHWQHGFALPRPVLEADTYIQTCCLKTHRFGGHFTMALKNNVGLVAEHLPGEDHDLMNELHESDHQRLMIAEINDAVEHDLIVLDAVEGLYEEGPEAGPVAEFDAIVAGTDPVAVDALGVALLRRHGTTEEVEQGPIADLEQIARASELGVGTADPDYIDVVTPDGASRELADELLARLET